jgi:hypothetical protein
MKTTNRLKGKRTQIAAAIAETIAPTNPPQPPTSEAVSLARRARVIERASQRIAQQRLEQNTKVSTKIATPKILPKLALPSPRPYTVKAPVFNSASVSSPVVPAFSEQTLKAFERATKALRIEGRSLNQRLLICHHHLQSDPLLAEIDPQELWREVSSQNQ